MRKTFRYLALIMLSIFVLSSTVAFSEVGGIARHDSKNFSYGLKAGINYSTITGGDRATTKSAAVFGAFGAIRFGSDVGISAELLYSRQGCEVTQTSDAAIILDYLNVPLLVNYHIKQVEGLTVKVGLQPAFLLSSKMKSGFGWVYEDGIKSTDFSIPIGVSYELGFGLLFDARFNIGITDAFDGSRSFNTIDSGNNMVFQFTVGYRF